MKYKISSLAKLLGVSSNTIRRYTDMGYITPEKSETNNYTYYDNLDIEKIIRVRMYRKFGFSHDEIKKMFGYDVPEIVNEFEQRLICMDAEIEKLKSLKHMFEANMIMVKRIGEYEQGYIAQNVEATYYIKYLKGDKLFDEKERLQSIQRFMYCLPETKEVLIFKKEDVENNKFDCSFGFAAKKKDTDKFNIEINKYMEFLPVQKCIYFLLKTYLGGDEVIKINNEIKKAKFKEAKEYLDKSNYRLNNNILGFNIISVVENGKQVNYTLICMPVGNYAEF